MCSMGSPRQQQDVTHDSTGVFTRTHLEHTQGQSPPRAPPSQVLPAAPLEGVPKFWGWVGAEPVPPHIRVRKRMGKREEEGGFHSNCLVSRETWREMSAQSWGWSREGIESPGVMGWHRLAPRDTSVSPIMSPVPQTPTLRWGRLCLTPNSGGCDSTKALNPEPHCPSHPAMARRREPHLGGSCPPPLTRHPHLPARWPLME